MSNCVHIKRLNEQFKLHQENCTREQAVVLFKSSLNYFLRRLDQASFVFIAFQLCARYFPLSELRSLFWVSVLCNVHIPYMFPSHYSQ